MVIPTLTTTPKVMGPPQGQWTYSDWNNLSRSENRYEIIDGVLYISTPPNTFHEQIIEQLHHFLSTPICQNKTGFGMTDTPCLLSDTTIVTPDFMLSNYNIELFIAGHRKHGKPDLIAEVLAIQNSDYDEVVKLSAYAREGISEYVVIDTWKKQLRLYSQPMEGEYGTLKKFSADDVVRFVCLPEIALTVSDLFTGSPDETL